MKHIGLCLLFVGSARAIIEFIDVTCGPGNIAFITGAFTDAIAVAADARAQLLTFDPNANSLLDPRVAIYNPLFNPGDLQTVINYLGSIQNILTTGYKLRIYCEGTNELRFVSFPDPNTGQISWYDTDFYHNAQPDLSVPLRVWGEGARPRGTWSKNGWTIDQNADCSNQAHIQISQDMLSATRPQTDNQFFEVVRSEGLAPGINLNALNYLRPLSRSILHELFHVVGGLDTSVTPPQPVVIDVSVPGTTSTYGLFIDCVSQKFAPISTVRQPECLTMLTAGLYLSSIQGRPAFWSVGVVDRNTLRPTLPGMSSTKIRHRALRNVGNDTGSIPIF